MEVLWTVDLKILNNPFWKLIILNTNSIKIYSEIMKEKEVSAKIFWTLMTCRFLYIVFICAMMGVQFSKLSTDDLSRILRKFKTWGFCLLILIQLGNLFGLTACVYQHQPEPQIDQTFHQIGIRNESLLNGD